MSLKEETHDAPGSLALAEAFDALLDAATDGIVIADQEGKILHGNGALMALFGYRRDELVGQQLEVLMNDEDAKHHGSYLAQYLRTGQANIIGKGREVQARHRDGSLFPIALSVGASSRGGRKFFVGLIHDIRERRRLEREAAAARERLAHVNRISTLGEMAAGIAHEVNQPLGAISNYAQAGRFLLDGESLDLEQLSSLLQKIAAQAERAGDVVRRLRALARGGRRERELCDVNELVQEVAGLARVEVGIEGVPVLLDLEECLPRLRADRIQIQQVVLNLMRNGLDAMKGDERTPKPGLLVRTRRRGDRVEVAVVDGGSGIDEGVIDGLMSPFVTTKETGMGMGLAICQSIVSAHGGSLRFEANSSGVGTTFYCELPVLGSTEP